MKTLSLLLLLAGLGMTDTPAIKVPHELTPSKLDGSYLMGFAEGCEKFIGGTMTWAPKPIACHWEGWTCADKASFLLTDEAGTKHCIRFAKEQP